MTATYQAPGGVAPTGGSLPNNGMYDPGGNVINDGVNQYLYDGEGRLCAVQNLTTGGMTEYIYDAEGQRVMKGTISTFNCDPTSNGFSVTNLYTRGLNGEDLTESTESSGSYQWDHTNVFASGELLATYKGSETYFALNDWLGTKRAEATPDGSLATYSSLPWGNELTASGTIPDATAQHYTGKERDIESGNDYFGARYYSSNMGRFMSPDPAGMMAVNLEYPQSLNRYAYVQNNPLSFIDPLGLDCAYLNNAGTGIENGGIDQSGTSSECGQTGGYWVNGTLTNAQINADAGTVQLTGTTNGEDTTSASYQDTNVSVGEYFNTPANPADHIAFGISNGSQFGLNPQSDWQFLTYKITHPAGGPGVPGAVRKQVGGQLDRVARIPVTGMQSQMIQNEINQSIQNPPNYDIGGGTHTCDCASWPQQILGDAGINTGRPTQVPNQLMNQLDALHPQQQ